MVEIDSTLTFNRGLLHTHMSGTLKNTTSTSGPSAPAVWQFGVELFRMMSDGWPFGNDNRPKTVRKLLG